MVLQLGPRGTCSSVKMGVFLLVLAPVCHATCDGGAECGIRSSRLRFGFEVEFISNALRPTVLFFWSTVTTFNFWLIRQPEHAVLMNDVAMVVWSTYVSLEAYSSQGRQ